MGQKLCCGIRSSRQPNNHGSSQNNSNCPGPPTARESTRNQPRSLPLRQDGQGGIVASSEPNLDRPSPQLRTVPLRTHRPDYIFSPTRHSWGPQTMFNYPWRPVYTESDQILSNSLGPRRGSIAAGSPFRSLILNTDPSKSYTPSDDIDKIPFMDQSGSSAIVDSLRGNAGSLSAFEILYDCSSQRVNDIQSPPPCADSSRPVEYFNFANASDVHIGDTSITNVTVEGRPTKLHKLIDETESLAERWVRSGSLFQQTRACDKALNTLTETGVTSVIGRKGDGKTSIARKIILDLKRTLEDEDHDIVIVEVEDPVKLISIASLTRDYNVKILALVDDIFGKSALDHSKVDKWQRKADDMWEIINESNQLKLVVTLRKHIWNKTRILLGDYDIFEHIVDLTSADMALVVKEKASILLVHLEKCNRLHLDDNSSTASIDDNLVAKVSEAKPSPPGYPQCCSMFATLKDLYDEGVQFFCKPSRYLHKLLNEFSNSDPNLYLVLALALVFGGRFSSENFSKEVLESRPLVKRNVEEIMESVNSEGRLTMGQIRKYFDDLIDVFFEFDGLHYRFNHDCIEEAMARHFGSKYPITLIRCCRLKSLQQWLCTKQTDLQDHDQQVVFLDKRYFKDLSRRLTNEINQGCAATVFSMSATRNHKFVSEWIKEILENADADQLIHDQGQHLWLQSCKNGSKSFLEFLLSDRCHEWFWPFAKLLSESVTAAACGGHAEVLEMLLGLSIDETATKEAFEQVLELGHLQVVQVLARHLPVLIEKRFNVRNEREKVLESMSPTLNLIGHVRENVDWRQAIHLAAFHGNFEIVRHLLDLGVDPNTADSEKKTALHHGAEFGYVLVVNVLLERPDITLDLNARDKHERTALHYAAREGEEEIVEKLIGARADIAPQDVDGNTPLHLASSSNCVPTARLLVHHGADLGARDYAGGTPMHDASMEGSVDIVQFLLEMGGDRSIQDLDGNKPIDVARNNGHMKLVDILCTDKYESAVYRLQNACTEHAVKENINLAIQG